MNRPKIPLSVRLLVLVGQSIDGLTVGQLARHFRVSEERIIATAQAAVRRGDLAWIGGVRLVSPDARVAAILDAVREGRPVFLKPKELAGVELTRILGCCYAEPSGRLRLRTAQEAA